MLRAVLIGLALGMMTAGALAEEHVVRLESLDLSHMRQGWGRPQVNRSIREKPLTIAGKVYEKGVGTHATSRLWVNLAGGTERFVADVGVDDATGDASASIEFRVYVDGKKSWESGVMKMGQPAKHIDLELKGAQNLLLMVGDGGDGISFDHGDWADARFIVTGADPKAAESPKEEAIRLTPKPSPAPRINGAMIFGVRPGSPVLYTIAATGDRPMTFSAEGLPEGISLDPQTGRMSGSLKAAGTHVITLKAANAQSTAQRKFRLVCGDKLALTPHMGWNSWYIWEGRVTDKIMRDAADAMVSTGMINYGYTYVNIDDCWAVNPSSKDPMRGGKTRDEQGRIIGNKHFPDMKALTDYIHAKGLKAGIYTSPGPLTCAGYEGAYQHEESDVRQFTEWGFDFLKHDWCSYGRIAPKPDRAALQKPYRQIAQILKQQPRDIVLNLCQYGMGDVWEWGAEVGGNSWRTAGDLGADFEGIATGLFRDGFDVYSRRELHKFGGPGGWNDPDYLLLGYLSNWRGGTAQTPLTPNEQYTQVSLWSIVAAPLIFSGDITRLDDFTLGVLCNAEVIDVDQDPLGKPGHRVSSADDLEVWMREMEDGSRVVGLFNRGEMEATVSASWADLKLTGKQKVRDLWRQQDLGAVDGKFEAKVGRHGVVMVRMWSEDTK